MTRAEVIAKLKTIEPQLRAHGVGALYLFGSHARDEEREDLDVDVFVDPASEDFYDLDHFVWRPTRLWKRPAAIASITEPARDWSNSTVPRSRSEAIRIF